MATCSRLLKVIGLFCKTALWKRRYSAEETYNSKEPTNRSHPISWYLRMCGHLLLSHPCYTHVCDHDSFICVTSLIIFVLFCYTPGFVDRTCSNITSLFTFPLSRPARRYVNRDEFISRHENVHIFYNYIPDFLDMTNCNTLQHTATHCSYVLQLHPWFCGHDRFHSKCYTSKEPPEFLKVVDFYHFENLMSSQVLKVVDFKWTMSSRTHQVLKVVDFKWTMSSLREPPEILKVEDFWGVSQSGRSGTSGRLEVKRTWWVLRFSKW